MEEIVESWCNLKLTYFEQLVALFEDHDSKDISIRKQCSLLGFIIADKQVNKEAFKNTICSVWKLKGKVNIKNASPNLFIFEFQ